MSRPTRKPAAAFPTTLARPTLALPPDHAEDRTRHPYEPKPEATTAAPAAAPAPRAKAKPAAAPVEKAAKVPWATRLPKERVREVKSYCAQHGITMEQAADAALRLLMDTYPEGLPK